MSIPSQLRNDEFRFCKIKRGTKKPYESNWPNTPHTWEEIQTHILREENYGILGGHGGLIILDSDTPELREATESLPETFRVKTGSGGTHDYFMCPEIKNKLVLQTGDKHYGEVISLGSQVVGPGSIHPNGQRYEVIRDCPIATITKTQLLSSLKPFIKEIQTSEDYAITEIKRFGETDINSIPITQVMDTSSFKRTNKGELQGSNPWHGSQGGGNTCINPLKNVGYCFRCGSGFNVAQAIALNEGIIRSCSDRLSRDDFFKVLDVAKAKYGLRNRSTSLGVSNQLEKSEHKNNRAIITKHISELLREGEEKEHHILTDIIEEKCITMIFGEPGSCKSILSEYLASCIATGKRFLGKFKVRKKKVLYLSTENATRLEKKRFRAIFKGMKVSPLRRKKVNLQLDFLDRRDIGVLDIDKNAIFYQKFNELINELKPDLLVIDTLSPMLSGDSNNADDVVKVFKDCLFPLIDEFGLCILVVLHAQKSGQDFLGSVKFKANADIFYELKRDENDVNILNLLCHKAREGEVNYKLKVEFVGKGSNKTDTIGFSFLDRYPGKQSVKTKGLDITKIDAGKQIILSGLQGKELLYYQIMEMGKGQRISLPTMKRAINSLYEDGKIAKHKGKKGGYYIS